MIEYFYPHLSIAGAAYLFVTLLLGLQLAFDAFRLRPTTLISRITGAAMLMDSLSCAATILANNAGFADSLWFDICSNLWDILITLTLLAIGEVLHSGRIVPIRMTVMALVGTVVWVMVTVICGPSVASMATLSAVVIFSIMFVRQTLVIIRHDHELVNMYSDVENRRGSWYAVTCVVFVVEIILWFLLHYLELGAEAAVIGYDLVMVAFWVYMARCVATQMPLNPSLERELRLSMPESHAACEVKAPLLTDLQSQRLKTQLEQLMTERHIYLDADLNIQSVCELLCTNRRYVSYVLNQYMGVNFNEYVNAFRVRHVTHLIETSHLKLAAIAYESGFNSPGAMSRTFRIVTGVSPQDYRRQVMETQADSSPMSPSLQPECSAAL